MWLRAEAHEAALLRLPEVARATVEVWTDDSGSRMSAVVVLAAGTPKTQTLEQAFRDLLLGLTTGTLREFRLNLIGGAEATIRQAVGESLFDQPPTLLRSEDLGLPPFPESAIVIRVPEARLRLYRLVTNDPPNESDFEPPPWRETGTVGEVFRLGLSHYLSIESADRVRRRPSSMIAELLLAPHPQVHLAATSLAGGDHVTVWARPPLLIESFQAIVAGPRGPA